jgi:hypothetical protein
MTVHHVNVDRASASALSGANLLAKLGKIGGKNRWKQLNQDRISLPAAMAARGDALRQPFATSTARKYLGIAQASLSDR